MSRNGVVHITPAEPGNADAPSASARIAAAGRLAARTRTSALALAAGAVVVYPAWSVFDRALESPDLASAFAITRLTTTVGLIGLLVLLWKTPIGHRWPVPLVATILGAVQITVGWMLPQVQNLELYLLGATLVLYASGAILAATPWWTLLLAAATIAGIALGTVATSATLPADTLLAAGVYLGSAAALSTIGHVLRWTTTLAEIQWRSALETEQATTAHLVAELRALSVSDPLTGLANRRRWDDELAASCARAADADTALTVVLIDIDHFKAVNDTAGHPGGDAVLVRIAALLHGSVREHDLAARLGGDELALLLTDTTHHAALALAERLRRQVQLLTFPTPGPSVTISVGVATAHGTAAHPERLLTSADTALYEAKTTRNTVADAPQPKSAHRERSQTSPSPTDALRVRPGRLLLPDSSHPVDRGSRLLPDARGQPLESARSTAHPVPVHRRVLADVRRVARPSPRGPARTPEVPPQGAA